MTPGRVGLRAALLSSLLAAAAGNAGCASPDVGAGDDPAGRGAVVVRAGARGEPLTYDAAFGRAAAAMQVGLVVREEGDEGARVVYADELAAEPSLRVLRGVVRPPPGADWPRPCHRYRLRFSSSAGELATGEVTVPGCPRALESLRGRALFHVGKGGPALYTFAGTLREYRAALGARPVLHAPLGRAPFFLGWKAAFARAAGVPSLEVRLTAVESGEVVSAAPLSVDPSWDSVAGGWEIPAAPAWPQPGATYELAISANARVLARGRVVVSDDGAAPAR